jgi:hypothetical protein
MDRIDQLATLQQVWMRQPDSRSVSMPLESMFSLPCQSQAVVGNGREGRTKTGAEGGRTSPRFCGNLGNLYVSITPLSRLLSIRSTP